MNDDGHGMAHVLALPDRAIHEDGRTVAGWEECAVPGCPRTPEVLFVWNDCHQVLCARCIPEGDRGRVERAVQLASGVRDA